jgi:hypothetical protein
MPCRSESCEPVHLRPRERYRIAESLDISACVCRSPLCHRHVGLKPEAGRPDRPTKAAQAAKRERDNVSPTSQIDGHTHSPSALASVRSKPTIVNEIFSVKGVRLTLIDCERATADEAVLEARRSDVASDAVPEYEIHGQFQMAPDGRAFPDTYWLTVHELWDAGLTKAYIKDRMSGFCEVLGTNISDAVHDLPEDEEQGEEEAGQ